jgi:hypothetical protein
VPGEIAANRCPQSHWKRRAGFSRLHLGHFFDQDLRATGFLTSEPAALRAAREIASARATAHCGCMPVREYDALPHTGHRFRAGATRRITGFFSLMVSFQQLVSAIQSKL